MSYQPIENYGIIGNMRTAALVGQDGSIDWLCFPHFDSPSIFGAIVDKHKGGRFRIAPRQDDVRLKQLYWPDTNVLTTRFLSPAGVGEIEDFMPAGGAVESAQRDQLFRRVRVSRGSIEFQLQCQPAFDYGRIAPETTITKHGAIFEGEPLRLALQSDVALNKMKQGAEATFTLEAGQSTTFQLRGLGPDEACQPAVSQEEAEQLFQDTVHFWRRWLSQSTYSGRWRDMVNRSALVLKLLTFEPTGAIVAAPTCSLATEIGGERNWDYRYTWIRDAAFTLYGLLRLGFTDEAASFMNWLTARVGQSSTDAPLQVLYGIDGRTELTETVLDHLEGYRQSPPVRVGNGAAETFQLDIYGELLDSVYLFNKYGTPISYDAWVHIRSLVDWVCDNWQRKDAGIWESRADPQHFVYSKLMCWVAVDRGLRLAEKRSLPADEHRWRKVRNAIYEEVFDRGWNQQRQAFVQSYGSDCLDGATLIMPLVFFASPADPQMLKTMRAINRTPKDGGLVSDGLVYRFDPQACPDGLQGGEGTFNMCSFWLVEALTRAGRHDPRRLEEARLLFERMLGYANHVGLYAEQTGSSGEALGNFPQGFTHLALISAAYNLDRTLG